MGKIMERAGLTGRIKSFEMSISQPRGDVEKGVLY